MAIGIGLVAWTVWGLDFSHIHLHSILNDQMCYVTGARNLLRTGSWDSNIIYPGLVLQPYIRNNLYMPGHFALQAAYYALFGYGAPQSYLANVVSYLATPCLLYLASRRLWGRRAAWLGVLVFWIIPFHLLFALTAMSESSFVVATALGLCVFVYLPDRWRPWAGPLCLIPPFLCRESGSVTVLLLASIVFARSRRPIRDSMLLVILSVLVLGAL